MRPRKIINLSPDESGRFWSQVAKGTNDVCWPWMGARLKTGLGYGTFNIRHDRFIAHRIAYEVTTGPLGALLACHKCDNPICCNPAHIFPGTYRDNRLDCDKKGRTRNMNSGKTHCIHGHEFNEKNTYVYFHAKRNIKFRNCRQCMNIRTLKRYYDKRKPK